MLRTTIAILGICLASAFVPPVTQYLPGYEYEYVYHGQVLTGVPVLSNQYSGLKIKCHAILQINKNNNAVLSLRNIEIMHLNNELPYDFPLLQLPDELFNPLSGPEEELMVNELSRPVSFRYEMGSIRELKSLETDPYWSLNIKRGVLNFLQINLNEHKSLDISPKASRFQMKNRIVKEDDLNEFYRVMEPGLSGECESIYSVRPSTIDPLYKPNPVESEEEKIEDLFHVTKIRNIKNCVESPINFTHSMYNGLKCADCAFDKKEPLHSMIQTRYNVTGTREKFLIKSAITEAEYRFATFSQDNGEAISIINQTFFMINAMEIESPIEMPMTEIVDHQKPLEMRMPMNHIQEEVRKPVDLSAEEVNAKYEQVVIILRDLVENIKPKVTNKVPSLIIHLVKSLHSAPYSVLEKIYSEYGRIKKSELNEEEIIMRNALWDALAAVGTTPSIELLLKLVKENYIPEGRVPLMLNMLSMSTIPTPDIIDMLLESIKKPYMQPAQTKRSLCLSVGTLIHKLFSLPHYTRTNMPKSEIRNIIKMKEKYTRILLKLYKTRYVEDKILALKTMGNAGLIELLPSLESIIKEEIKEKENVLVIQSIYALRRITPLAPKEVQRLLIPIVINPHVPHDIRIAAFVITLDTRPSFPVIHSIVHGLNYEKNLHVKSYIYSWLKTFSLSTRPCDKPMVKKVKLALHLVRPFQSGIQYSKMFNINYYDAKNFFGAAVEMSVIGQKQSIIPRSANIKLMGDMLGYSSNILEAGIETEGMQKMVDKIFGMKKTSYSSVKKELNEINRKLKIADIKQEEPRASIYVKLFGNELRFFTLDIETVNDFIRDHLPTPKKKKVPTATLR